MPVRCPGGTHVPDRGPGRLASGWAVDVPWPPPAIGISWCYGGLVGHLDQDLPVYGLQARQYSDPAAAPADFAGLVDDYVGQIRSIQPHGPYSLLGWSFGGTAAHAVAVRLQQQGEQVAFLASLDGYPAVAGSRPLWRYDDPEVGPAIVRSLGHDPGAPGSPLAGLGADNLAVLPRVFVDNHNLRRQFSSGLFAGEMMFLIATEDRMEAAALDAWAPYVTGPVEVHEVACTHGAMTQSGPLAMIGRLVAERLNDQASPPANGAKQAAPGRKGSIE